jgi:peptide/nickel transport system ATP-binding protein/peptide/nickel transport system permease protein
MIDLLPDVLQARVTKQRLGGRLYQLVGVLGVLILAALLLVASFPAAFAPYNPDERVGRPFQEPGATFLLGTNDIGQDLFSELIWGTRASLTVGFTVGTIAVAVGTIIGLVSGYYDNLLSHMLLRLIDLTLVLPYLPLIILLSAYLGASQRNVILVLTLVSWAAPARLVRARVLETITRLYVTAARATGGNDWRILSRHIWPNVRSLVLVQFVLVSGTSILVEAGLSFLGLGDPSTKSWGSILYFAQASGVFLSDAWLWWVLPTGIMITLSVLSLVMLSYALENRLEPRLQR